MLCFQPNSHSDNFVRAVIEITPEGTQPSQEQDRLAPASFCEMLCSWSAPQLIVARIPEVGNAG